MELKNGARDPRLWTEPLAELMAKAVEDGHQRPFKRTGYKLEIM